MRFLIGMSGWSESLEHSTCIGIRHTQAHNIVRQLQLCGVEIVYCNVASPYLDRSASVEYYGSLPIPAADHALIIEPIAFHERTFDACWEEIYPGEYYPRKRVGACPFLDALRRKVSGCIATIADADCIGLGMEDILFYHYRADPNIRVATNVRQIAWAADADVFFPQQNGDRVQVLLDHPHYVATQPDHTDRLVESLKGVPVDVKRLARTDVETINPKTFSPTDRYNASIPQSRLARIHGQAHVFCTTHTESQGLSVLEAAMCGSLVVAKKGHIRPVLLDPLQHYLYNDVPDWNEVLRRVDVRKCRDAALPFNRWDEVGAIVYDTFMEWR